MIWRIDRLGGNLRDLVDILQARGVGVQSLCDGPVHTTTAHGIWCSGCSR